MSEKVLPIRVKLDGDVKTFQVMAADAEKFAKAMASAVVTTQGFDKKFVNLAAKTATFDGIASSIQSLMGTVHDLTDAYASQQEMEAKLGQVMRNTMDATDRQIDSIKRLCSQQQELGVIGDEVQLAGAQELSTYLTKTSTLKKLIPVMNDMLAQQYGLNATQESAANIATMLGKVMDGQRLNVNEGNNSVHLRGRCGQCDGYRRHHRCFEPTIEACLIRIPIGRPVC